MDRGSICSRDQMARADNGMDGWRALRCEGKSSANRDNALSKNSSNPPRMRRRDDYTTHRTTTGTLRQICKVCVRIFSGGWMEQNPADDPYGMPPALPR